MNTTRLLSLVASSLLALSACGPGEETNNNTPPENNNQQTTPAANNNTNTASNNQTTPQALIEPSFSLAAPANGTRVEGDSQVVEVRWEDGVLEALEYAVNDGEPVVVTPPFEGGAASFDVPVEAGIQRYVVTASFEGGFEEVLEFVLVKDEVGGGVLLVSRPVDGAVLDSSAVVLEGSVVSEVAVSSIEVRRGDETFDATLDVDGEVTDFTIELPLLLGENTFSVVASLEDDVILEDDLTVTCEADGTAPELLSALPIEGHDVRGTRAYVQVVAIDNVSVTEVEVTADGEAPVALTRDENDEDRFVGWLDLSPGWNAYVITARDEAGNETSADRTAYQGHRLASGGAHGGAILDGVLHFWGRNNKGQVGLGYTSSMSDEEDGPHPTMPVALSAGANDFTSLSISQNTSVALDASGNVWAWGDNDDGQLGLGTADPNDDFDDIDRFIPEQVTTLSQVVMISRGFDHTLALDASGNVWAWGKNTDGQLGDGTTDDRDHPVQVPGLSGVVSILGASATSYAILADGTVWAWGENTYGNLGAGVEDDVAHPVPAQVPGLAGVVDIAAGRDHVVALTTSSEIYTWGLNASNQAGPGEDHVLSPLLRDDVFGAVAVYAGGNQSFIEDANGRLFGWGQNFSGNLGLIDDGDMVAPTAPVFGVEDTVSVAIGALQGLALRRDGRAFAWGWSFEGSLGGGEGVINRWGYRVPILIALPEEGE